jgi:hypothetical protein
MAPQNLPGGRPSGLPRPPHAVSDSAGCAHESSSIAFVGFHCAYERESRATGGGQVMKAEVSIPRAPGLTKVV